MRPVQIYLIDFGNSEYWKHPVTGDVIPPDRRGGQEANAHYVDRRKLPCPPPDKAADMQALGWVLCQFLHGLECYMVSLCGQWCNFVFFVRAGYHFMTSWQPRLQMYLNESVVCFHDINQQNYLRQMWRLYQYNQWCSHKLLGSEASL